jgi:hypothetical protein
MKNLYKNLIMGVFMFCSLPSAAQVFEEHALSPGGILSFGLSILRLSSILLL